MRMPVTEKIIARAPGVEPGCSIFKRDARAKSRAFFPRRPRASLARDIFHDTRLAPPQAGRY